MIKVWFSAYCDNCGGFIKYFNDSRPSDKQVQEAGGYRPGVFVKGIHFCCRECWLQYREKIFK